MTPRVSDARRIPVALTHSNRRAGTTVVIQRSEIEDVLQAVEIA